jgi:transposase InsO family protein
VSSESLDEKQERRFTAVLILLRGEPASQIVAEFGICRSDLYKFRIRALTAMWEAVGDYPRGPKIPHNRISKEKKDQIKTVCARHPTLSSYQICERLGLTSPCPRTIQRVRQRLRLSRLPKRAPPQTPAKRFSSQEEKQVASYIRKQSHLGVLRLAWDITNKLKFHISASTVLRWRREINRTTDVKVNWQFYERKHPHSLWHGDVLKLCWLPSREYLCQMTFMDDYSRAYVVCELTTNPTTYFTIQCLIQAMRQWQVIPKAILVDNGSEFKGFLLKGFCENLGIRLIHIRPFHPQTNGKLERAFRDDRRDFYGLKKVWLPEPLKRDLPDYVFYRNYQRGHWALNGRPAISRLKEQNWVALPSVLNRLEEYARHEIGERRVDEDGYIRILARPAYLGRRFRRETIQCFETFDGFEVLKNGFVIGTLPKYQEYRRLYNSYNSELLPRRFILHRSGELRHSPRIAVA